MNARLFFASLRKMIAAQKASEVLGNIAIAGIEDKIIPKLEAQMKTAVTPDEAERIQEQINTWKQYTSGSQKVKFEVIARNAMSLAGSSYGFSKSEIEDFAADTVGNFYNKPSLAKAIEAFKPSDGILKFLSYWKRIVYLDLLSAMRDYRRHNPRIDESEGEGEGEEDSRGNALSRIPSRGLDDEDDVRFESMVADMMAFVRERVKSDPITNYMFELWADKIDKDGPDSIKVRRDIIAPVFQELSAKGKRVSEVTLYAKWKPIYENVIRFFKDELDMRPTDKFMKSIRLAVEVRVAEAHARKMFASWMLCWMR